MPDLTTENLSATFSGRRYEFYAEIASTNDRAMALLYEDAPAGTIVLADLQTQGRGRLGRGWHAPRGTALMLSYLLRPAKQTVSDVGMMGALAVCEAVEAVGASGVGIKWPNDVQIGGRKVCGVLPESVWQGEMLLGVILGIGLNVHVDFTGSPLADTAISLDTVAKNVTRLTVLTHLLERLDSWAGQLGGELLFTAWQNRLNMIGRAVSVAYIGATISGIAEGVTRDGALLVRDEDGFVRRAVAGDIALG